MMKIQRYKTQLNTSDAVHYQRSSGAHISQFVICQFILGNFAVIVNYQEERREKHQNDCKECQDDAGQH